MLSQHIALVPEAGGVNASELARVCAALQKQLTRDLLPVWGINATIDAFPHLEDVPLGYWPIIITFCDLGDQAGVHIDRNGQPYAQVEMTPGWSLHASQACLDMLVNPFGRRLMAGPSPRPDQGPVEFLLEIGAPCSSADCAYLIDEVLVSDFCTPSFWGALASPHSTFSFTGMLQSAHQVLQGGHLTWHDPISDKWWVRHHLDHSLVDTKLGSLDGRVGVVREAMRLRAPQAMRVEKMTIEAFESRLGVRRQHSLQASQFQAHRLRTVVAGDGSSSHRELETGGMIEPKPVRGIGAEGPTTARLFAKTASRGYVAQYPEDDGEVEVTHSELLAEDERLWANLKEIQTPEAAARRAPPQAQGSVPSPVRSKPPPLPEEPRQPQAFEAQASQRQDPLPETPIAQTPLPQAPLRATPLPPPRMPERPFVSPSTVPPVALAAQSRPPVNTWLLAATLAAAVAISFLGFALYTRATSSPDEAAQRSVSNTSPVVATQAAASPTPPPVAIVAPAPSAPIVAAPAIAQPVAPPATAMALPPAPVAAAPTVTAAVAAVAPPPSVAAPALAPSAPPPPAKVVRAKIYTPPPAAPRRAASPATDDSDPLEGLIGERR